MATKPLIAVTPIWDDERQSIWMLPGYLDGITLAGGIPVILPLYSTVEDILTIFERCDGLLLTGGHDVSPRMYGEDISNSCGTICDQRDKIESALYANALKKDIPVLGICRGIQLINVLHGGTLYQDLPTEHPSAANHHMQPPYTDICHSVNIVHQSPLYDLLQTDSLGVNSYHHQAIKKLGNNLSVMAVSQDGLAEAVCVKGKRFIWAVQWHPEFDFTVNPASCKIFSRFINSCKYNPSQV